MMNQKTQINVLVAEDDEDDYAFLQDIFKKIYPQINLIWAKDGEELISSLFKNGEPKPAFVLVDLNMPKKDGRQVLKEIRTTQGFQDLPVIIFTTSASESDKAYVNGYKETSFVTKPIGYLKYVDFVKATVLKFIPELAG